MEETEKAGMLANLALMDLKRKTRLLSSAGSTRLLKVIGGLAALAWLPIIVLTQKAFSDHQSAVWYVAVPLTVSIILLAGYTRLTNDRIDALIKLLGEDKLLRDRDSRGIAP